MALNEEQINEIKSEINKLNSNVKSYIQLENEIINNEKILCNIKIEYSKLTEEEKLIDTIVDVFYNQQKKVSLSKQKENDILQVENKINLLKNDFSKIKSNVINNMVEFPFPIDINKVTYLDKDTHLGYFENIQLDETVLKIMSKLLDKSYPLEFNDVIFTDKNVIVKNEHDRKNALLKTVNAIKNYRIYVEKIANIYENIDVMLDRIKQSVLYDLILLTLYNNKKSNTDEIANILNQDIRKVYDACYNLTRNNWSPNPIEKLQDGSWGITISGKILVERYIEKYNEDYNDFINNYMGDNKNGFS